MARGLWPVARGLFEVVAMRRLLKGSLWFLVVVLLVCLGGVLTLFMLRNAQWVVIRVPLLGTSWSAPMAVAEYETPLAAVMVVTCAIGAFLAMLAQLPFTLRRAVERRRERRFMDDLEGELSDLRNLPVTSPAPLEDDGIDLLEEEEGEEDREDEQLFMASLQRGDGSSGRDGGSSQ